jgi:alkanesulfonate monooxygenase SsuD/methylene tetrahydromethanopterin reductase-like flavin-dependent oxidoreductase (luciferase family)
MFEDRTFYAGVGTGENLNEHVLGDHWPEHAVRIETLEDAIDVIRELWTGREVSHDGDHYTVENTRLFTLPEEPPPSASRPTASGPPGPRPRSATASGRSARRTSSRRGKTTAARVPGSASSRPVSPRPNPKPSRPPTRRGQTARCRAN